MKKTFAIIVFLFVCLAHTAGLGFATFGLDALRLCVSARENAHTTATTNALGIQALRNFYDNNGNVTNRLDANGTQVRTTYDTLNRPTAVTTLPGGGAQAAPASSFTYAANGNMLVATNVVFRNTFAYDTMNRLTNAITRVTHTTPARTFTTRWQRDPGGLVTNLVYATGKNVAYTRDADGNIIAVKDWLGNQWTFTRDNAGRLTQITPVIASVPAKQTSFSYDNAGRLSSWQAGNIAGRTISYDALNRRVRDDITHGAIPKPTLQRTASNTFDAADKLVSANVRYGQGTNATPHTTESFYYDDNGALEWWDGGGKDLWLGYDEFGRLDLLYSDATAHLFEYDTLGNRIVTYDLDLEAATLWIPDHADPLKRPLMECDEFGTVLRYYIWGENRLLGYISGNGILAVVHSDDFGSVIAITEGNNLIYSANYGPHGEDWGSIGMNPTPFTWLGGYGVMSLDDGTPLKLYLTRYRLYSATLNRFLSSDPLGLEGGFNLYEYGSSNPMMYVDPLGLCAQSVERNFFDNFALGFMVGDFTDDLGWGGTAGQIVAGLIPIYGQIADGRDITANALGIWDNPGSGSAWVGLGASVVGLVPLVGDAAKAGIRSAANAASDAGKAVVKNANAVATLPKNARILTNETDVFKHLQKYNGIDPKLASERLHAIKKAANRGPADNVLFDMTGNVYDPVTKEWLGSMTYGGAKAIR